MSHQTGIRANDELRSLFGKIKNGSHRLVKIVIENEQLTAAAQEKSSGTWEQDYDSLVVPLLDNKLGAYIMYRFDSKNSMGYEWLLIAWSPDFAPVREKMLYAATRATLKQEFGSGQIKDEIFGTVVGDVNLDGYKKHVQSTLAPKPLTMAEEEAQMIKENEVNAHINTETRNQTLQGVAFPLSQDAQSALLNFKDGRFNYVQLSIDIKKETIELASTDTIHVKDLISHVPMENPRYHIFNFQHTHEGDPTLSTVFIYSMPGYTCSIKERMLYSSCKSPFCDQIDHLGVEIAKKLEIDDPSELTEEYIYDEIHPKKNVARQAFAKPKGPAGRGPKRMHRKNDS